MGDVQMGEVHTGRCACGAVSYETSGPLRPVSYCHCESCRRQSGHFVAATSVPLDAITINGAENLADWHASPEAVRQFCKICGSQLFWRRSGGSTVSIMVGSMDQPTGLAPAMHIFVAEKGDYYGLDDGLPQHAAYPAKA